MNIPNALLIVAAAKLRADDQEKKDETALPGEGGTSVLPDIPLPGMVPPMGGAAGVGSPFQPGAAVREILSGRTGVVVEGPQGDFGTLTFMKADEDQQTYAIPADQLEAVSPEAPPASLMPPVGAEPEGQPPVPAEGEGEAKGEEAALPTEPTKPKASLQVGAANYKTGAERHNDRQNRIMDKARSLEKERLARGEKPNPNLTEVDELGNAIEEGTKPKASLHAGLIVSDVNASKAVTYGQLKASLTAPAISASKLIDAFGYVPASWDHLLAALQKDGVVILRSNAAVDVPQMVRNSFTASEIIQDACAANGAVRSLTLRQIAAIKGALLEGGDHAATVRASNKVRVNADGVPTTPMPDNLKNLPDGMVAAWDGAQNKWYATSTKPV